MRYFLSIFFLVVNTLLIRFLHLCYERKWDIKVILAQPHFVEKGSIRRPCTLIVCRKKIEKLLWKKVLHIPLSSALQCFVLKYIRMLTVNYESNSSMDPLEASFRDLPCFFFDVFQSSEVVGSCCWIRSRFIKVDSRSTVWILELTVPVGWKAYQTPEPKSNLKTDSHHAKKANGVSLPPQSRWYKVAASLPPVLRRKTRVLGSRLGEKPVPN